MEGIGVDIYGTPSDEALSMMRSFATASAPLRLRAELVGGYLRPGSGAMPTRRAIDGPPG